MIEANYKVIIIALIYLENENKVLESLNSGYSIWNGHG